MKLAIVTSEYGNSGGVQTVVNFVLGAVHNLTDWEAEVVSLRMSRRAFESRRLVAPRGWRGRRVSTRTQDGVLIRNVGAPLAELEWTRYSPRPWLNEILASADVILVVAGTPALAASVKKARVPVVLQVATMAKYERAGAIGKMSVAARVYRRLMMKIVSRLDGAGLSIPDSVLVENELMLDECVRAGARNVQLLPPGVDTDVFAPASRASGAPYLLMIGRLADPRKNLPALIRSYALARDLHGVTQRLVLGGLTSPSVQDVELIASLGLEADVHIHSALSQDQLVNLYQQADVFVSTSLEEGLGLTFVEALACGVPVVTTDTAGASFVLGGYPDAGSIVPHGPEFVERFAATIAEWCADSAARQVGNDAARQRAVEGFSLDTAGKNFVDAIEAAASVISRN